MCGAARAASPDVPALPQAPLLDTEATLLIDHGQAQVGEADRLLEQGVGANNNAGLTGGNRRDCLPPTVGAERPGEQGHAQAERCQQLTNGGRVLACQEVRRR